MSKVNIAIAGLGNRASSLLQGIEYYRQLPETDDDCSGLMHYSIGPYRPFDIELVAAFDIDRRKVGRPADNWSTENLFAAAQAEPIVRFARQFPQIDVRFYNPAQDPIQQIGELTTGADVVWIGNWGGDERAEQIRDHLMAESPEQMRQHIQLLTASETRRQERAGNAVETIRTRHNCDLRAEQLEHICETSTAQVG